MKSEESRKKERRSISIISFIRKPLPGGGYTLMQFLSKNLSIGGIFVITEDLSIFDMDDELEILLDDDGNKFYEGKAKVVRSARVFSDENQLTESGFGLLFLDSTPELSAMLEKRISGTEENPADS